MKDITAKDEALAPVVAFLLLLVVVVSFISLLNAYYIPSLKQQEEVQHLKEVEEMFRSITGDIHSMEMLQRDSSLQRRISLGGGAVMLSPMTSSGTLRVEETELLSLVITTQDTPEVSMNITTVSISYAPIGNFWVEQGYVWEQGLVNVTKGSKSTWLEHTTSTNAEEAKKRFMKTALMPQLLTNNSLLVCSFSADSSFNFRSGNGMSGINLSMIGETMHIPNVTAVKLDPASTVDTETHALLNDLITNWKKPSFEEGEAIDFTIEKYDIKMQVG
jgi:hypothetical protein